MHQRDEVTGEWRMLPKEEDYITYSSPNIMHVIISKRNRWAGHVECLGNRKIANRILVGKPNGRRPFGTPRNDIKIYFQEM